MLGRRCRVAMLLLAFFVQSLVIPAIGFTQPATPVVEETETPTATVETTPEPSATETTTPMPSVPGELSPEVMPVETTDASTPAAGNRQSRIDPPLITLNGSTDVVTQTVNKAVHISIPAESEWSNFASADCTGEASGEWSSGSTNVTASVPMVLSFQARWINYPEIRSNCVTVTWREASPTLTVDGSTGPLTLPVRTSVLPSIPPGAEWTTFDSADCSGTSLFVWSSSTRWFAPGNQTTGSFQARWEGDDSTRGNCVTVTWVNRPTITVNGYTRPVALSLGQVATPGISANSEWASFASADCSGAPVDGWSSTASSITQTQPGTWSFQARLIAAPEIFGNCVPVTWRDNPQLTVNGSTGLVTVPVGTSVSPSIPPGAEWAMFGSADCPVDSLVSWVVGGSFGSPRTLTISFQARWQGDDATRGNCVTVTWVNPPALTVNGSREPVTLNLGQTATPELPADSEGASFASADCSGAAVNGWSSAASPLTQTDPGTWSFRARLIAAPDIVSNCVTVTWRDNPQITINGSTGPITLPISGYAGLEAPAGIQITSVAGTSCEVANPYWGLPPSGWSDLRPRTWSFQARWPGDDATRGNCVTVTWEVISVPVLADEVCGDNNNVITPPRAQTGISVDDSGWANNSRTFTLSATGEYTLPVGQQTVFTFTDDGPCVIEGLTAPTQAGVCGINNDVITVPEAPDHVTVTDSGAWSVDSTWTITYTSDEHYRLPDGFQAEYIFTDPGNCIIEESLNPPTSSAVCGSNNDEIILPETQPEGVNPVPEVTQWSGNEVTVTYAALPDYVFAEGVQRIFIITDEGPCVTSDLIPPTQTKVCGTNNDTVIVPEQPANVRVDQSDMWSDDGTWRVTFTAAEQYILPEGAQTEYVFTDSGPCVTGAPIPPIQTNVCGPNNDIVLVPDQPSSILVNSDERWKDETWTVTFSAAEHYVLPEETQTAYVFTDESTPCSTNAPVPPVQVEVCGPNNDLVTIPEDQPEGVTLEDDTGWANNTRIISFAIDPAFATDGPTTFTLTDADEPCAEVGKQITITFQTSDGGTIAGTEYALYAPVASQVSQPVFAEGVVNADNQIILEGLIAGEYRLVTAPTGYEPVDTVLSIGRGDDAEEFVIQVTALQAGETPTSEPTVTPSPAPTDVPPTIEPTVAPTTVPSPSSDDSVPTTTVTGLPETGSGSAGQTLLPVILVATFTVMIAVIVGGCRRT